MPYNEHFFVLGRQHSSEKRTRMYSHESREFKKRVVTAKTSKKKIP